MPVLSWESLGVSASAPCRGGFSAILATCGSPDGFVCPRCAGRHAYALVNVTRLQCAASRHQVSLTKGTILHNTKDLAGSLPLGRVLGNHRQT